jgi:hypothetical protein
MSDNAEIKSRDVIKAIEGFEESISIISKNIYGQDCSISCNLKAPKEGSFSRLITNRSMTFSCGLS